MIFPKINRATCEGKCSIKCYAGRESSSSYTDGMKAISIEQQKTREEKKRQIKKRERDREREKERNKKMKGES